MPENHSTIYWFACMATPFFVESRHTVVSILIISITWIISMPCCVQGLSAGGCWMLDGEDESHVCFCLIPGAGGRG